MSEDGQTIYQICREQAGYTQQNAAELLGCSVRQLARYESGETPVPEAVAYEMDALYSNHFLAYRHLRETSRLAASILPAVEPCGLQTAVMRFHNLMKRFWESQSAQRMLEIAEDGRIDAAEIQTLDEILAQLELLTKSFMELRMAAEEGRDDNIQEMCTSRGHTL